MCVLVSFPESGSSGSSKHARQRVGLDSSSSTPHASITPPSTPLWRAARTRAPQNSFGGCGSGVTTMTSSPASRRPLIRLSNRFFMPLMWLKGLGSTKMATLRWCWSSSSSIAPLSPPAPASGPGTVRAALLGRWRRCGRFHPCWGIALAGCSARLAGLLPAEQHLAAAGCCSSIASILESTAASTQGARLLRLCGTMLEIRLYEFAKACARGRGS